VGERERAMKTLGLTPFQIYPPQFGGGERCFNLLTRIPVDKIIGLSWAGPDSRVLNGVPYELIPAGERAGQQATRLRAQGIITFDAMPTLTKGNLTHFQDAIDRENPDLIILEHPWLVGYTKGRRYIYDAHNAEHKSFVERFGDGVEAKHIRALEKQAVEGATAITYCSTADLEELHKAYTITAPTIHIPNGVNLPNLDSTPRKKNLLFVGSVYQPNVDAAQRLINLAPLLHGYTVQIAGGCSDHVTSTASNVELLGHVSDEKLHTLFSEAHAFVNLVTEGSGTHLKLGRALAYGLPILTTPIGARGYTTVTLTNGADIHEALRRISTNYDQLSKQSRAEAETLTWDTITQPLRDYVNTLR
jgi:glycosyltransferase involved in cell wall biosynthesis